MLASSDSFESRPEISSGCFKAPIAFPEQVQALAKDLADSLVKAGLDFVLNELFQLGSERDVHSDSFFGSDSGRISILLTRVAAQVCP